MLQARNTKSVIDYTTGNEKMAKIIKDVSVYSGAALSTDYYLLSIRISFPTL
jgi:hypothetical protein